MASPSCLVRADGAARLRRSAAPSADICRSAEIFSVKSISQRLLSSVQSAGVLRKLLPSLKGRAASRCSRNNVLEKVLRNQICGTVAFCRTAGNCRVPEVAITTFLQERAADPGLTGRDRWIIDTQHGYG